MGVWRNHTLANVGQKTPACLTIVQISGRLEDPYTASLHGAIPINQSMTNRSRIEYGLSSASSGETIFDTLSKLALVQSCMLCGHLFLLQETSMVIGVVNGAFCHTCWSALWYALMFHSRSLPIDVTADDWCFEHYGLPPVLWYLPWCRIRHPCMDCRP